MVKRILGFDKQDWYHIGWLFMNMMKNLFIKFNWREAKESYIWITIHLTMNSKRVD